MSIQLNCDPEVLAAINKEAKESGCSSSVYVNKILYQLFNLPVVFKKTRLQEVAVYSQIFSDDTVRELHMVAEQQRRHPEQMLIWLVEQSQIRPSAHNSSSRNVIPIERRG